MIKEYEALLDLAREIQSHSETTTIKNDPERKILQSTVAFIFRVNPQYINKLDEVHLAEMPNKYYFQTTPSHLVKLFKPILNMKESETRSNLLDVLFIQRQINEKDLHSGQIALPGGHVDGEESDFQAILREVREEVGLKLMEHKNTLYLGKFPRNFYCYPKKDGNLHLTAHVFVLIKAENEIHLDTKELRAFKWVPFGVFLEGDGSRLVSKKVERLPRSSNRLLNSDYLKRNFIRADYGAFNLNMDEVLWGLTFFLTGYMIMMIKASRERSSKNTDKIFLNKYINHTRAFDFVFKSGFAMKIPANLVGKGWYIKNRVKEFSYSGNKGSLLHNRLIYFGLYLIFILFIADLVLRGGVCEYLFHQIFRPSI